MIKFSIVIPSFNRAKLLLRAIESVVSQSADAWELIIVDDGSTDSTRGIVGNYQEKGNVRYLQQKHSGVSAARNRGVAFARADYVIFLDSDDQLHPNLLEDLLKIDYENYDLICWEALKIKKNKKEVWKPVKLEKIYNYITASFLAGTVCYRKQILIKAGGFDPNLQFGENYELGIRLSQTADLRTRILSKVYLNYYVNTDFRPKSHPILKLEALKYHLDKHINLYRKDSYSYSRLLYQLGYLNEKLSRNEEAFAYFKQATAIRNFYIKARLKKLYYQMRLIKLFY